MENDLVSIILPVYNGEQYLAEAIKSCLSQSYSNLELIILNDCSKDTSLAIAKHYEELDPRVSVYSNGVNLRLPKTLNKGHELSKGKYITWTSDDNRFCESAIENLIKHLKYSKADLVYAHCDVIDHKGEVTGFLNAKQSDYILFDNVVGACFLYTKDVYDRVGCYDPNMLFIEDYDFWLRIAKQGKICELSQTLYEYRFHNQSLTSKIEADEKIQNVFNEGKYRMFERLMENKELKSPKGVLEFLVNSTYDVGCVEQIINNPVFFEDFYVYSDSFESIEPHYAIKIIVSKLVDVVLRNARLQHRDCLSYLYRFSTRAMLALPFKRQLALARKCI